MPADETYIERWTRRAADAAVFAISEGAAPDAVREAVEAGISEGLRIAALRKPDAATPAPAEPFVPEPGSAIAALMNAVKD